MRLTCVLSLVVLLALSGCGRGGIKTDAAPRPNDSADTPLTGAAAGGAAGKAADAAALDARLVQLRQTDPAEFEREAAAVAGGDTDPRAKFLALLRLAEYRRDAGSSRKAAPDFLRLVAFDPERAASSGVLDVAFTSLIDAGLLLEVDCLDWGPFRGRCAAALLDDLYPSEPAAGAGDCTSRYLALTPSYPELAAVDAGRCAGVDSVLFQCRVARAALEQLDAQATTNGYARFAESVQALLSGNSVSSSDALLLQACCAASAQRLSRMFSGDYIFFRAGGTKKLGSTGKAEVLMGRLCELSLDCLDVLSKEPGLSREKYLEILQQHVDLLKNLNQREKVVACYTRYLSRFTDSAEAAPLMLQLADYYREGWKTPAQAKDTYAKLCETYPDSPEAPVAQMKEALCLYELGAFEDAYAQLQEIIAAGAAPDPATAEFLLGLTEAAMGLDEDAEARLIRLVNAFPAHETASKSVFWIANSRFAQQDYKGAKKMFAELVQRYPKSSYAKKAGEYVKRLEMLDAAK
ncbi:MAG TPA: tetratricopeptide repeat protein [Candidatus Bathyarchaeia archaeon]|nr:tetratricopeptide repeat protein [Candidatus Bathyarchaeia archaeon]